MYNRQVAALNKTNNAWHDVLSQTISRQWFCCVVTCVRGTIRMVPHGVILRFCVVISRIFNIFSLYQTVIQCTYECVNSSSIFQRATVITFNGVARIFVWGGPPGTFCVISPGSRPHSVGGGGSSRNFP